MALSSLLLPLFNFSCVKSHQPRVSTQHDAATSAPEKYQKGVNTFARHDDWKVAGTKYNYTCGFVASTPTEVNVLNY